jgi:hypothetical protein
MARSRKILSFISDFLCSKVFRYLFIFVLLLVLLVTKNAKHMADRMFWLDEVFSYLTVIQPFWEIPKHASLDAQQMQPPLFYWFGHLAANVSTDPFTLRSVSLAFYVIMIGFIIFALRELQFAARIFLCFVLIMSPFGAYATTEFRAYALAALSILISSVFLYRAIKQPSKWLSAMLYGLAALTLQYSLSLNCFVFGLQMVFLGIHILYVCHKKGFKQTLTKYKLLMIVSVLLCIEYALFLNIIWKIGNSYYPPPPFHLLTYIKAIWINGQKIVKRIMLIRSWTAFVAIGCFFGGFIIGLRRNGWITAYLIMLLGGQLLFSTFMTFSRITWYHERYFVASYIAFAMLCALGAEYLFQRIGRKPTIILLICLLGTTLPVSSKKFFTSLKTPKYNPIIEAIEPLRCNNRPTMVLGDPAFIDVVPMYAYRNDPLVITPDKKTDLNEEILQAASEKYCFILEEYPQNRYYEGKTYKILSVLPGYTQKKYSIKPDRFIPDSAWVFTPIGVEINIHKSKRILITD